MNSLNVFVMYFTLMYSSSPAVPSPVAFAPQPCKVEPGSVDNHDLVADGTAGNAWCSPNNQFFLIGLRDTGGGLPVCCGKLKLHFAALNCAPKGGPTYFVRVSVACNLGNSRRIFQVGVPPGGVVFPKVVMPDAGCADTQTPDPYCIAEVSYTLYNNAQSNPRGVVGIVQWHCNEAECD
jgi:hypothetical protein